MGSAKQALELQGWHCLISVIISRLDHLLLQPIRWMVESGISKVTDDLRIKLNDIGLCLILYFGLIGLVLWVSLEVGLGFDGIFVN